ncbi:MAG TPA: hypothetical protein VHZ06_07000 [Marmoricola sp.]|nr:hypothetical protein [Marmoricola sp.]
MNAFGQDLHYAADAVWKVAVAGVVLGAGLPAVYAVGIRALASGQGGSAQTGPAQTGPAQTGATRGGNPLWTAVAVLLFAIVLYCVAMGIVFVVATGKGDTVDFSQVWPQINPGS